MRLIGEHLASSKEHIIIFFWLFVLFFGLILTVSFDAQLELLVKVAVYAMQQARVGSNAFLAVIPDPVTCFSTAKYSQRQVFKVVSDSSLLLVDWITSGRHERGEKWDFDLYKSTNHIFHNGDEPLFLDTVSFFLLSVWKFLLNVCKQHKFFNKAKLYQLFFSLLFPQQDIWMIVT